MRQAGIQDIRIIVYTTGPGDGRNDFSVRSRVRINQWTFMRLLFADQDGIALHFFDRHEAGNGQRQVNDPAKKSHYGVGTRRVALVMNDLSTSIAGSMKPLLKVTPDELHSEEPIVMVDFAEKSPKGQAQ
jgi:hypothetical protein